MKRIAVFTPAYPPYRGGMGTVAYNFAKGLKYLKHHVEVFTVAHNKSKKSSPQENDIVRVHLLRPIIRYGLGAFVPQIIWKARTFDVIHLHYPFFGGAEVLLIMKLIQPKIQIVLHYHFDAVGKGWLKLFFIIYSKIILPILLIISHSIIATSKDYLQSSNLARSYTRNPKKFVIIPNGVSYATYNERHDTARLRKSLSLHSGTQMILFVGALDQAHYFKGITVLLSAWQKIVKLSSKTDILAVVGRGNLKSSYEQLSKQLHIDNFVKFVGMVSDDELVSYYQLADVTVLPSIDKSEAFGLVLLESLSSETPVIASNLPGVRCLIEHEQTGWLVRPHDSHDLMNAILTAFKDKKQLRRMGKRGSIFAKAFDWTRLSKQLSSHIELL